MKKSQNSLPDSRSESLELSLRLYRAIGDIARQLDEKRSRIGHVRDMFADNIELQRMKLKDYCEKLMFTDPVGYGKKAEEILWRKAFYEVFTTSKRLNKNGGLELSDRSLVQFHLQSGIGYYHHLIMKIQAHFKLDLRGIVDFPLLVTHSGLNKEKQQQGGWGAKVIELGGLEWCHGAVHRCLIYLGDLSRYLADLDPTFSHTLPIRYYSQALNWKPQCGLPHNQLGTLASNQNYGLDAVYYYMRCLCCTQKFEGSDGNLQHLFECNETVWEQLCARKELLVPPPNNPSAVCPTSGSTPSVKKLLVTFIQVAHCMFFDKNHSTIQQLCGDALTSLETCISEIESNLITVYNKPPVAEPTVLTDDVLFKMLLISFMSVQQLQSNGSPSTMGGVALGLALMSQLLHSALRRLEAVLPPRLQPTSALGAAKRRGLRRRVKRRTHSNASDLSDENDSVYSADSDISEEDLVFDRNDSDEDVINGFEGGLHLNGHQTNGHHCVETNGNGRSTVASNGKAASTSNPLQELLSDPSQPWAHPLVSQNKSYQHIHKLCNQGYLLQTIKVCCDWLLSNSVFLESCGPTTGPLLTRLVHFLNHLSAVPSLSALQHFIDDCSLTEDELLRIPLPEDMTVRGLSCLEKAHEGLKWDCLRTRSLRSEEETYARIFKLIRFGSWLAESKACPLKYDPARQWFSILGANGVKNGIKNPPQDPEEELRGGGGHVGGMEVLRRVDESAPGGGERRAGDPRLKLMGELWLKSEVCRLESRAKMAASLSPYLVPDMEVFLNHPSLVKQLVSSKKFIVLIPMIVVSGLDEYKGGSGKVRETIRWLEAQLRAGHRSLRVQRANEALPLPFIKYPKKKDREAWLFLQVVECCNYLCNQSTGEKNPDLVTLLTGSKTYLNTGQNGHPGGFSHIGVAKSAGINVEHIESFYSKWKSCIKSHG